ncbi:hypothetical protein GLX_21680 [Komagataeibacter medellinensis NBRC 3288]|uniref:Uncharacterized protein n=1 Tax=Komagataeibacter medellinensis (strain NBRC 3288 / BCRC 11682 / LMG 1693 / Kondo 51) TaxID=634177 RepID=G2I0X2_KOMMN|nr:hypothetical protein GLX_21680 [Komagataeibacter medellinensis NBRC 3288]
MFFSSNWLKGNSVSQSRFRHLMCATALFSALCTGAHAQTPANGAPQPASPTAPTTSVAPVAVPASSATQATPATSQTADAAPAAVTTPPEAQVCVPSTGETGRVLVIGDSQAQGLAGGLRWLYRTNRNMRILDHSKISTGLVSVAFYNWPDEVHKLAATEHADVAVIMFGANDRPPVRVHGAVDQNQLANFTKIYSSRVRDIIVTLKDAHIPVIWVGHPMVRDDVFSADMAILNNIFQDQAIKNGAQFVPLWSVFSDNGHFSAYGEGVDGSKIRLRADDGVHLTPSGYQKAAKILEPMIACYQPNAVQQARVATTPLPAPASTTEHQSTAAGPS